jgi:glycosyltransferase involved in cell wall biosynthesis
MSAQEEKAATELLVSVVVPVFNEERHIAGLLASLLDQEYPSDRFEILVVDGGSTDGTVEIVKRVGETHSNLLLLENPRRLSSSGRNVGARAAKGDVVLFVDGHCEIPDELLLRNLSALFQKTSADVICRPQPLQVSEAGELQKAIGVARSSWFGHNPSSLIFSVEREGFVDPESSGAAYTRRVFEEVGYFDETFDACEDVDFNLRAKKAGLKAYTSPSVTVRYHPREDIDSLYEQMLRYGAGRGRLFAKHPVRALLGALLLSIPTSIVLFLVCFSFFSQGARLLLLFFVVAYLSTTAVVSVALSFGSELRLWTAIFRAFLVIHAGLFLGFWKGLFAGLRTKGAR